MRLLRSSLLIFTALVGSPIYAQADVGEVAFANSGAPAAQAAFRRGLAQLHNFEYPRAAAEFRKAQEADPSFAMAYWGEAMTHTHPIWFRQDAEAARAVLERLGATPADRQAKAPTQRERDYLAAIEVLYGEGTKNERDFLYAEAMRKLHEKYPDDVDARAFYALALLGTTHQGRDTATYMRAAAVLEEVFPANQKHPGVLHYLIHAYDDPVHAPLGLRAARLYGGVAPNAGHALHMTSHIFVALGMWNEVVDANRRAVDVVNRDVAARNAGKVTCGHYPTWLHYGYLQTSNTAAANKALADCRAAALEMDFVPWYRIDSRRGRIDEYSDMRAHHIASGLPVAEADAKAVIPDGAEFLDARHTAAFSDVLLAYQRKDGAGLDKAVSRLRALQPEVMAAHKDDDNPAPRQRAEIMLQEAEALVHAAAGRNNEAIALLQTAAKAEASMAFEFGPPPVPKPAGELLGDLLLAAGRAAEANSAYEAALRRTPGRREILSMMGSARAQRKDDKTRDVHVH